MSPWRWSLTGPAEHDLRRLDDQVRRRVLDALDHFAEDPTRGDVRRLRGRTDEWRLRVGDWRVRFRFDAVARTIVVTRVLPRGRAYRD